MDHNAYPHIVETILRHCDFDALRAFRDTSRKFRREADKRLFYHVALTSRGGIPEFREPQHPFRILPFCALDASVLPKSWDVSILDTYLPSLELCAYQGYSDLRMAVYSMFRSKGGPVDLLRSAGGLGHLIPAKTVAVNAVHFAYGADVLPRPSPPLPHAAHRVIVHLAPVEVDADSSWVFPLALCAFKELVVVLNPSTLAPGASPLLIVAEIMRWVESFVVSSGVPGDPPGGIRILMVGIETYLRDISASAATDPVPQEAAEDPVTVAVQSAVSALELRFRRREIPTVTTMTLADWQARGLTDRRAAAEARPLLPMPKELWGD